MRDYSELKRTVRTGQLGEPSLVYLLPKKRTPEEEEDEENGCGTVRAQPLLESYFDHCIQATCKNSERRLGTTVEVAQYLQLYNSDVIESTAKNISHGCHNDTSGYSATDY